MKNNCTPVRAASLALALFIFLSRAALAQDPPSAISTPGPQYVGVGNTAYFTVTASGTSPFNFQWQRDGTNIANAGRYTEANVTAWTGATFDIANVNTGDSDTYYVVVTNLYGAATSGPVVLSVGYPPVSLNVDPASETVKLGGTAEFDAFIGGTPPFTFHWQLNGADIPADNRVSSTNETLVISPVEAGDAGTYTITRISNVYGNLIASGFNGYLTVLLPPSISTQPQGQSVPAGTNTTFSVSATSANGSISYQWYFNGTNIPWALAASMTLTNVQATNAGRLLCHPGQFRRIGVPARSPADRSDIGALVYQSVAITNCSHRRQRGLRSHRPRQRAIKFSMAVKRHKSAGRCLGNV